MYSEMYGAVMDTLLILNVLTQSLRDRIPNIFNYPTGIRVDMIQQQVYLF